jgi:hypothetical protein
LTLPERNSRKPAEFVCWDAGASARRLNASDDLADIVIDGNQSFGIQLAEWNVQGPLVLPDQSEAVISQMDTFSNADTRCSSEQQSVGKQIIRAPEFL